MQVRGEGIYLTDMSPAVSGSDVPLLCLCCL